MDGVSYSLLFCWERMCHEYQKIVGGIYKTKTKEGRRSGSCLTNRNSRKYSHGHWNWRQSTFLYDHFITMEDVSKSDNNMDIIQWVGVG